MKNYITAGILALLTASCVSTTPPPPQYPAPPSLEPVSQTLRQLPLGGDWVRITPDAIERSPWIASRPSAMRQPSRIVGCQTLVNGQCACCEFALFTGNRLRELGFAYTFRDREAAIDAARTLLRELVPEFARPQIDRIEFDRSVVREHFTVQLPPDDFTSSRQLVFEVRLEPGAHKNETGVAVSVLLGWGEQ